MPFSRSVSFMYVLQYLVIRALYWCDTGALVRGTRLMYVRFVKCLRSSVSFVLNE